ncbi:MULTISPECIES: hypothetical protein [unclassified Blastococcus]
MNRALRAATMGVLLFSPLALSACSAGQVTQTATQERDKVGAMAQVGDIVLRQVAVTHPEGGRYEAGDDATLRLAIVNTGVEDETLTGVTGEGFGEATISAGEAAATSTVPPNTGGGVTGSTDAPTGDDGELEIPAGTTVFLGEDEGPAITLTDLDEELTTGGLVELTFTFENAGEIPLTVPVATPDEVLERGESFDFHHSEEEGGHGAEEIARERESDVGDAE